MLMQCHIKFNWGKIFNYLYEIDIFRNPSQKYLGVLMCDCFKFGCHNDTLSLIPSRCIRFYA